jgi:hypothetical protein
MPCLDEEGLQFDYSNEFDSYRYERKILIGGARRIVQSRTQEVAQVGFASALLAGFCATYIAQVTIPSDDSRCPQWIVVLFATLTIITVRLSYDSLPGKCVCARCVQQHRSS